MLTHPTHERLITLGLTGMAKAFEEQRRSPDLDALSFEERIGIAGRSRSCRARHKTSHDPPQVRRAAPERMRGRRRFAHATRHRPRRLRQTRRRRLDRPQREPAHHRGNRARQKLDCLRPRPQSLPRQSLGPVSSRAAPVRGACPCSGRRPLWPHAQNHRPGSTPDPRRLGPFGSQSVRTARPSGDP